MSGWLVADWPAPPHVRTLLTTRDGGVSNGPYASLNLGDHVGDAVQAVAANRARLRQHLPAEPCWLTQVHGTRCLRVQADSVSPERGADASVTVDTHTVCAVLTADCLPVLLCDQTGTVVAAAHAGWRGLAAGVLEATVQAMERPPATLLAWLGPAIGPTAFEVGDEVRQLFCAHDARAASAFMPHGNGKWLCDIYALARQRLAGCGVCRVTSADYCTYRQAERFFSFRRDGVTGRMASLIWIG